jgi:inner membrane protein
LPSSFRTLDPVTHTLLGASIGYARCGRQLGVTAALVGGLTALSPDADVFIRSARDPLLAIVHHRGFTHSLLFAPVGTAIVASLWLLRPAWRDRTRWFALWRCGLLAYISHCLLDAATSYGTQLFWPLTNRRFGWDWISVIDPIVTVTLLVGIVIALRRQCRRPAIIAASLVAAYLIFGAIQHSRGVTALRTLAAARGHTIERLEVMPTLANNLVWRALYVHEGRIWSDRLRIGWFSAPTVREGWSIPHVSNEDLTAAELERDERRSFERFAWFSENWVARSPGDPTILADMRYSLSAEAFDAIWGIRFTPPSASTEVEWINRSRDRRIDAKELWMEIAGRDPRFRPLSALRITGARHGASLRGVPSDDGTPAAAMRPGNSEAHRALPSGTAEPS